MGVSMHVYVGPYLVCEEPVTRTKIDRCEGHGRGDAIFCPFCGTHKENRYSESVSVASSAYWEDDENADRLIRLDISLSAKDGEQTTVAISNFNAAFVPGLQFTRYDSAGCHDIPDKALALVAFTDVHALDIEKLQALGVTVTVKFGALSYYA